MKSQKILARERNPCPLKAGVHVSYVTAAIPLLDTFPKNSTYIRDTYAAMFIVILFTIARE